MGCCISRAVSSAADTETQQLHAPALVPQQPAPAPPPPPPFAPPSAHPHPAHPYAAHPYAAHPHPAHPAHPLPAAAHHHHPQIPLGDRYNYPLVRKAPWVSKRPITSAALQRARDEFWDTRVTGRAEVWGALRVAVEMLEVDLQTAQGIVDAAGITVPTGDLSRGVYDESGHRYEIPDYCFSDPVNVSAAAAAVMVGGGTSHVEEEEETDEDDDASGDLGKGKMRVGPEMLVKARLSDRGGPDVAIRVDEAATVRRITVMIEGRAQLPATQRISLVYLGRILEENKTLVAQGWKRGDVVNALVRPRQI